MEILNGAFWYCNLTRNKKRKKKWTSENSAKNTIIGKSSFSNAKWQVGITGITFHVCVQSQAHFNTNHTSGKYLLSMWNDSVEHYGEWEWMS